MAPRKQYVFAVMRREFDDEKDKKGVHSLVEVHSTVEGANESAEEMSGRANDDEIDESELKDGCRTYKNKTEHFTIQIKKMELKGDADGPGATSTASSVAKPVAKSKKASSTASASGKATKATKAATVLKGVDGSLNGMKLIFTGTFNGMNRASWEETAKAHGAEILGPTKLDQADYIILGTKAGQKKLDEIEEKGLKTIDDEELKEMMGLSADEPAVKKRKA